MMRRLPNGDVLEYAIGNVAVAISWANYFNTLMEGIGVHIPRWLTIDFQTAHAKMPDVVAAAPAQVDALAWSRPPSS